MKHLITSLKSMAFMAMVLAFVPGTVLAEDGPEAVVLTTNGDVVITMNGQYRARFEYDENFDITDETSNEWFQQRARLGFNAAVGDQFAVHIEGQDVRVWSQEGTTDSDAPHFTMHQAFGQYFFSEKANVKVGRQEIILSNERLVGNDDWKHNGRAFDGAHLALDLDSVGLHFAYLKLAERLNGAAAEQDAFVAYIAHSAEDSFNIDGTYILWNDDATDTTLHTLGFHAVGTYESFGWHGEAYYQAGTVGEDVDISAFLVSLGADYTFDVNWKPQIGLNLDHLSGDDGQDADKQNSFNTLFGSNSNFYGFQDFFLDFGSSSDSVSGKGLNDIHFFVRVNPTEKLNIELAAHHFSLPEDINDETDLGLEFDLTVTCTANDYVTFTGGYSIFVPGTAMEYNLSVPEDDGENESWAYLMADFKF